MYNKLLNLSRIQNTKSGLRSTVSASKSFTDSTEAMNIIMEYCLNSIADIHERISPFLMDSNALADSVDQSYDHSIIINNDIDHWFDNVAWVDPSVNSEVGNIWDRYNTGDLSSENFSFSTPNEKVDTGDLTYTDTYVFAVDVMNKHTYTGNVTIFGDTYLNASITIISMLGNDVTDIDPRLRVYMCSVSCDGHVFYGFGKGFYDVFFANRSLAADYAGFVSLETYISNMLSNMTALDIVKETAAMCSSDKVLDAANLATYVTAKTGNITSTANGIITEVTEVMNTASDKANVISWMQSKFKDLMNLNNNSSNFSLTDNNSLVTKSLLSGFMSGIASLIGPVITIIGTAVGGIAGLIVAGIGIGVTLIKKAIDYVNSKETLVSLITDYSGKLNEYAPWGLMQHRLLNVHRDLIDVTGASIFGGMGYRVFNLKDNNQEIHLKANVNTISYLQTVWGHSESNELSLDLSKCNDMYDAWAASVIATPDINDISSKLKADMDEEIRWRIICSLAWFITSIFMGNGPRRGTTVAAIYSTDSGIGGYIYEFLSELIRGTITRSNFNNYGTWDAFSNRQSGSWATAIGEIMSAFTGYGWFQNNYSDSTGELFSDLVPVACDYASSNVRFGTPEYVCYRQPINSIEPPSFDASSFWTSFASLTAAIIIATTAIALVSFKIRRKMAKSMAIRRAKAGAAWQRLEDDPTGENYASYRKAVRSNNLMAKLCNGTVLNKTCYWDDATDSSDGDTARTGLLSSLSNAAITKTDLVDTAVQAVGRQVGLIPTDTVSPNDLNPLAKSSDLADVVKTSDITGLARASQFDDVAKTSDLTNLATKSDIPDYSHELADILNNINLLLKYIR